MGSEFPEKSLNQKEYYQILKEGKEFCFGILVNMMAKVSSVYDNMPGLMAVYMPELCDKENWKVL